MAKQIALHGETGEMWKRRKRKPFLQYVRHHWWLYLMIVPGAIYFIIDFLTELNFLFSNADYCGIAVK